MSGFGIASRRMTPLESVLSDPELVAEIQERLETRGGLRRASEWNVSASSIRSVMRSESGFPEDGRGFAEAIINEFARPALLVRHDSFELPEAAFWRARLLPARNQLERALRSVGRIELINHPSFDWVGTGWVVAERIVATNRHVAELFAKRVENELVFRVSPSGQTMSALVDFKEEFQETLAFEVEVERVIFLSGSGDEDPDLALLELKPATNLPNPIALATGKIEQDFIATIGYPARDSRNGQQAVMRVFGDIFDVKRLAPGKVMFEESQMIFTHDCSTLGGNSGSAIIDLDSGKAVGIHFAGIFRRQNFALHAAAIEAALSELQIQVPVAQPITSPSPVITPPITPWTEDEENRRRRENYSNRLGYDSTFLGEQFEVSLPQLTATIASDAAFLLGMSDPQTVLKYTHFSVVMNRRRRLAFYTAVNIDGNSLRRFPRSRNWRTDPRVAADSQAGDDIYRNNDLDRGHLVRRLDPVWGDLNEARLANDDTFHFTNAAPQIHAFNDGNWGDLEDYILDNAGVHELKLSVFTGPVFQDTDPVYRGLKLPRQFWKVVTIVKDSGELSSTAYMLSQADLLTNLEFAFGQFRTYQVPVSHVEFLTGLDFGILRNFDPKNRDEARPIVLLSNLGEMKL